MGDQVQNAVQQITSILSGLSQQDRQTALQQVQQQSSQQQGGQAQQGSTSGGTTGGQTPQR
jgi:hypothetical protein